MISSTRTLRLRRMRTLLASAALAAVNVAVVVPALLPSPAHAQDAGEEARLRKLEAEVRALQRKVFPGSDGRFFEPQIAPGAQQGNDSGSVMGVIPPATQPATTAVSDILVRLDSIEAQLQSLTARSEEQANTLAQFETRLAAIEAGQAPVAAPQVVDAAAAQSVPVASASRTVATLPDSAPAATPPAPAPAPVPAPSAERILAVQAIAKPSTEDAGDDEYSYGFRLWNAGFFPEARQQLTKFVEQYPDHRLISFGRNLLGRAFLDDSLPEEAARWFLRNYQSDKDGARAPDSLLYLGQSMVAMNDTRRACIALAEFGETYPLIASGRLADAYQATRAKVTCS